MEITARVTVDAVVHKVNADKEVVNFSIAINDSYKPRKYRSKRSCNLHQLFVLAQFKNGAVA